MQDLYLIYLRKSRKDLEAEAHGAGETLARHEKALLEFAKLQHLPIGDIYRELKTGDSIAARPVMQRVLSEVEQGLWRGVLVMEVPRLARGDTIDQGIVAQTFKYSSTKIVTPGKTYDPNNEMDEDFFEYNLFMSRGEYKWIKRRLQNGRVASIKEGKYVAHTPPYGYRRVKLEHQKGWSLVIFEEEAAVIRMIFNWYTVGVPLPDGTSQRLGISLIARRLNDMHVKAPKGKDWMAPSIRDILINPTYIGMLRWNWRPTKKRMDDGKIKVTRPRSSDFILNKGLHEPIISRETFDLAQSYIHQNHPVPVGRRTTVKNPLAGLVICGKCGRRMVRRPYGNGHKDTLMCPAPTCGNVSSDLGIVERHVLKALGDWLRDYRLRWESAAPQVQDEVGNRRGLDAAEKEIKRLDKQIDRTHDLLEQGVYDIATFLGRSKKLESEKDEALKRIKAFRHEVEIEQARAENQKNIIPKVEHLLEVYDSLPTAKAKNDLLKEVLEKVVYKKDHGTRWHGSPDDFDIEIFPKLPNFFANH